MFLSESLLSLESTIIVLLVILFPVVARRSFSFVFRIVVGPCLFRAFIVRINNLSTFFKVVPSASQTTLYGASFLLAGSLNESISIRQAIVVFIVRPLATARPSHTCFASYSHHSPRSIEPCGSDWDVVVGVSCFTDLG